MGGSAALAPLSGHLPAHAGGLGGSVEGLKGAGVVSKHQLNSRIVLGMSLLTSSLVVITFSLVATTSYSRVISRTKRMEEHSLPTADSAPKHALRSAILSYSLQLFSIDFVG